MGRLKGGELMNPKEKKQETFRQIEEISWAQGWIAKLYEPKYKSLPVLELYLLKHPSEKNSPSIDMIVDCKDKPYISLLKLTWRYPDNYLEFNTIVHLGIEELPKLLERICMLSVMPERISKFLQMKTRYFAGVGWLN